MKLTHIFWSLAILAAAIFGCRVLWHTSGSLNQGLSIYAFILLLLGLATTASPILILLIVLKKVKHRENPWATFLFIVNSFWGLFLTFEIITRDLPQTVALAMFLMSLNFLWAILLLILASRKGTIDPDHYVI